MIYCVEQSIQKTLEYLDSETIQGDLKKVRALLALSLFLHTFSALPCLVVFKQFTIRHWLQFKSQGQKLVTKLREEEVKFLKLSCWRTICHRLLSAASSPCITTRTTSTVFLEQFLGASCFAPYIGINHNEQSGKKFVNRKIRRKSCCSGKFSVVMIRLTGSLTSSGSVYLTTRNDTPPPDDVLSSHNSTTSPRVALLHWLQQSHNQQTLEPGVCRSRTFMNVSG